MKTCTICGVGDGLLIVRSSEDPARYLWLDDDFIHYTPDGEAIRLSELPDEFTDNEWVRVKLRRYADGLLCQRCALVMTGSARGAAASATRKQKRLTEQAAAMEASGQGKLF